MAHRTEREKDRRPVDEVIGYRPDHHAGPPCGARMTPAESKQVADAVARAIDAKLAADYALPPRRIANVRRASTVARYVALAALTLLALAAFVGVAYVWGD